MSHSLHIFGASVRAAACSALAGGELPRCADRFADRDLVERCQATGCHAAPIEDYPAGLVDFARTAGGPWMYTGALENHPRLVAHLMEFGTLLGCGPPVLARVRDPFHVAQVLHVADLPAPELRPDSRGLPRDGSWLRKSRRSSAGLGVEVLSAALAHDADEPAYYFQQRIAGQPMAAIFLAAGCSAVLLGATRQIFAAAPGLPGEFRYAGSVGPWDLDPRRTDRLQRLGNVLAAELGLRGLFGVDYIDTGRDILPVEINPRYTASVEILERARRFSAVQLHVAACREGALPTAPLGQELPSVARDFHGAAPAAGATVAALCHAKQILTAPAAVVVTESFSNDALAAHYALPLPQAADIPWPGTEVRAGAPVMTVFAEGETPQQALTALQQTTAHWQDRLQALAAAGPRTATNSA